MRKCANKECGKKFKPTNGAHKYCGNQKEEGTCSYENHKKMLKHPKKRIYNNVCKDCKLEFKTHNYGKSLCGRIADKESCVAKSVLRNRIARMEAKRHPVEVKKSTVFVEVFMTPRLAQLEFIKKHNRKITRT